MLNIELRPEYVVSVFGLAVTNSFFTTVLVTALLVSLALLYSATSQHRHRLSMLWEVVVSELLKLTDSVTEDRALSKRVLPLIATFFLFIISANLLALLPGFLGSVYVQGAGGKVLPLLRSPNSDLTTTLALAIISVFSIQWISLRTLGAGGFIRRFFNLRGPVEFVLGFFEILSESVKVISFSVRLFGNIFAGEILFLVVGFFLPYILPVPFMILEVFVGVIQAFVFAMLTLTFIKTSLVPRLAQEGTQEV